MSRLAVLVSGRGTNLGAIAAAHERGELGIEPSLVLCNVEKAPALDLAARHGIASAVVRQQDFASREVFDQALSDRLMAAGIDLVFLAGFMRVLSPAFCRQFAGRLMNVHPSLLPAFPGAHAVRDTLAYGAKVSGVTVHFVDAGVDSGPIILQEAVAVAPHDSEDNLHARLQVVEHRLVPQAIRLWAEGQLVRSGRVVTIKDKGASSL